MPAAAAAAAAAADDDDDDDDEWIGVIGAELHQVLLLAEFAGLVGQVDAAVT